VFVLNTPEDAEAATVALERMRSDRCEETGPFDIVGDVHGCYDELTALLERLGYVADAEGVPRHPEGRRIVFLGDLVNRGPRSLDALRLAMRMTEAGAALCLPGNHENLLLRWIGGTTFPPAHGLRQTLDEIDALPGEEWKELKARAGQFLRSLESHLILDGGRLVVAHAGMPVELTGRMGVRHFALYGETRGEIDGYARRKTPLWALRYRSPAHVIYGHAAVVEPKRAQTTLNVDTGCVFGGKLTALRYPEGELVSVPAARAYFEPDERHRRPDERAAKGSDERGDKNEDADDAPARAVEDETPPAGAETQAPPDGVEAPAAETGAGAGETVEEGLAPAAGAPGRPNPPEGTG